MDSFRCSKYSPISDSILVFIRSDALKNPIQRGVIETNGTSCRCAHAYMFSTFGSNAIAKVVVRKLHSSHSERSCFLTWSIVVVWSAVLLYLIWRVGPLESERCHCGWYRIIYVFRECYTSLLEHYKSNVIINYEFNSIFSSRRTHALTGLTSGMKLAADSMKLASGGTEFWIWRTSLLLAFIL